VEVFYEAILRRSRGPIVRLVACGIIGMLCILGFASHNKELSRDDSMMIRFGFAGLGLGLFAGGLLTLKDLFGSGGPPRWTGKAAAGMTGVVGVAGGLAAIVWSFAEIAFVK
jgi:hypothetical protein